MVLVIGPSVRVVSALPPAGFIYSSGTRMMLDGSPIQLFGVDETTAFFYTVWGGADLGKNMNFPSGPNTKILGVTTIDQFWREYFRYFLHYQQVGSPYPNLLRIAVAYDFGAEDSYNEWNNNRDHYYEVFDRMIYWAERAGVYIVPSVMHQPNILSRGIDEYYDITSTRYAHLLEYVRAMMQEYDDEPQIAMWDIFNEPDINVDENYNPIAYWEDHGGFEGGYLPWAQGLLNEVTPYSTNHLVTLGHAMTSFETVFPSSPLEERTQPWFNAFSDLNGLDVAHVHWYATDEVESVLDQVRDWAEALGKPFYAGEVGYNAQSPPGHWPWLVDGWLSRTIGPVCDMSWWDSGKGPYADYPYTGALPDYPPEGGGGGGVTVQSITTTSFSTDSMPHYVAMPATVNAGDLLIAFFASDGTPDVDLPSGWTFFFGWDSWGGTGNKFSMYAKRAAGTEGGTTVNFQTTTAEKAAAQVYRITGWRDSGILSNDVEWVNAGATGTSPNPPSLNPAHWDVENTLWIAAYGADDDHAATAYPTGYTGGTYTESDASATSTSMGSARRINAAASEDPGTFTIAASAFWIASTVAVRSAQG
jgi:hypothetical protein